MCQSKLVCFAGLVCIALILTAQMPVTALEDLNPIILENRNPGSDDWQLLVSGYRIADEVHKQIVGYADKTSVNKGETIEFKVSVKPIQNFTIDIYRMGWYSGLGGRLLKKIGPMLGTEQPACPNDLQTGLLECRWITNYKLNIPESWTSGAYLAVLTNNNKFRSHITFIVRDDKRIADILYQVPVLTYEAYNGYPGDLLTGKSLYDYNSYGLSTIIGTARSVKVASHLTIRVK